MNYRWITHSQGPCPSCSALSEQVHSAEEWAEAGLFPKCRLLECRDHCLCELVPVDDYERGELPIFTPIPEIPDPEEPEDPMTENQLSNPANPSYPENLRPNPFPALAILQTKFQVSPAGKFQIIAISTGTGNGLKFPPDVLKTSLPLWDGIQCFVDHDGTRARSVTQLAGACTTPEWDEIEQGIRMTLVTAGPAGAMINELGRLVLSNEVPDLNVGFSADVSLLIEGNTVKRIVKPHSLDVVYNPARGGKFIRVLNQKENHMTEPVSSPPAASEIPSSPVSWPNHELEAARSLLQNQNSQVQQQQTELAAQREFRRQMCALLLEQGVSSSRLPQPAQDFIRTRFTEEYPFGETPPTGAPTRRVKLFNPSDLTSAIEEVRSLSGSLSASSIIQGPSGMVGGMFTTEEQLQVAVDDLLGAPRDEKFKNARVHRLSGIRELYLMLTGDDDIRGSINPQRIRLQHTTTTFTGLVKNALNKALVNRWEALGRAGYDWWQKIATVEHFTSINQVTWLIFGTISSLPSISEGAEYTELQVGDSPETSNFTKYGGYVGITLETLDRDDTRKLSAVPRELANAGLRNISSLVAAVFSANAGAGPTMADTGALFNATALATAGGHLNLLTTALSAAQWETVATAMYNKPMLVRNEAGYRASGAKMALNPKYCLVPRDLELTAYQIFNQPWDQGDNHHYETTMKGKAETVVVPDWTDATDWAAVADPALVPGIMVGERFGLLPEIFVAGDESSPAVFMNDESRIKVRHFITVGVADYRPLANNHV